MEGNQEQSQEISAVNDNFDLLYNTWLSGEGDQESLSILYPEIKPEYFKNMNDVMTPIYWKPKHKIEPYGKVTIHPNTRQPVIEIGIKGEF